MSSCTTPVTSAGTCEAPMSDQLTLFAEGSLARTSASPAKGLASLANDLAYSTSSPALLARYDHDTRSWKTSQLCLVEGLETFLESWPRSGTMHSGIAYQLLPLVPLTDAIGSGLLVGTPRATQAIRSDRFRKGRLPSPEELVVNYPTPSATSYGSNQGGAMGRTGPVRHSLDSLDSMARTGMWPTPTADGLHGGAGARKALRKQDCSIGVGNLNPEFVEYLMGFPLGHTDLEP